MSEMFVFWAVCAIVGYVLGSLLSFRRDTKEQFEWLWHRVVRLERKLREIEEESGR